MGKVTYHGYDEGYDPRVLRLGNLAFDFAEPKKHGQYIHPEIASVTFNQLHTVLILKEDACVVAQNSKNGQPQTSDQSVTWPRRMAEISASD